MFLDIETVPVEQRLIDLSERMQGLWVDKYSKEPTEGLSVREAFADTAALYAEFNKVICVSVGYFVFSREEYSEDDETKVRDVLKLRVRSLFGDNEREILADVATVLAKAEKNKFSICAHYGKGFDFPVLAKKYIIHRMAIPHCINPYGKKPWDMKDIIDTAELWKGIGMKSASLDLIAAVLGIPSPKQNMKGSEVGKNYYAGKLTEIVQYCEADVVALARVVQCFKRMEFVRDENVSSETQLKLT